MMRKKPAIATVQERIFTTNLGTLLYLKACGFVEEYRGKILEVAEDRLKVRIGGNWLERILSRRPIQKPVDVTLEIKSQVDETLSAEELAKLPSMACAQVDITIEPKSPVWSAVDFESYSRRMLWAMRKHFISP